ncbi:hypothetical protein EHS25_006858 [Saitozyma podzolica]|uniref:ERCC4 domain-containing protein n=1 Tax=Saitozyma podzolica TaxID=1890683 RepID=A0A427XRU4_9TREE|nr:hypothetical protein EHS25_006858 [Saitozyma podzolica]
MNQHPIIISSDDEGDGYEGISFVGSSRGIVRAAAPIIVDDDSEDEQVRPIDLDALLASDPGVVPIVTRVDIKGKGKAAGGPSRSIMLDEIDHLLRSTSPGVRAVSKPAAEVNPASKRRDVTPSDHGKRRRMDPERDCMSKEDKEALKAQEKKDKQLAKDAAKAAKEAERSYQKKLTEVNRLRTSKNDTVREIHLYLSWDLESPSSPIAGALPEIRTRVSDNFSQIHFMHEEASPVPGVIRFKRHVQARWDPGVKRWLPLDVTRWEWENTVVMIVTAEEIVDKIAAGGGLLSGWASDVRLALGLAASDHIIVMIKGLQKYYAKTKSLANREFTAAARAGLDGAGSAHLAPGARVPKDTIERELVKLQVGEGCFLVHVEKTEDIEDWVFNLAADVAIRPYKLLAKSHLNFAPQDGIKKGATPGDAFELMLQEVQGITPSAAAGIAADHASFSELMEAFEVAERRGDAEEMLQDCEIRNLRNGVANGRRLNKALAKRVYHVFRGHDSLALA